MARFLDLPYLFQEMEGLLQNPQQQLYENENCENSEDSKESMNSSSQTYRLKKSHKNVNWHHKKQTAMKTSALATKQMFERIFQLHAAYKRDIVILIHYKDAEGDQIRYWGSPGKGEEFLNSGCGAEMKMHWQSHTISKEWSNYSNDSNIHNPSSSENKSELLNMDTCSQFDSYATSEYHTVISSSDTNSYTKCLNSSSMQGSFSNSKELMEIRKQNPDSYHLSSQRKRRKKFKMHLSSVNNKKETKEKTSPFAQCPNCNPENIFIVEDVLSTRLKEGVREYLVKWSGWSDDFNTWEPESNIIDKSVIDKFKKDISFYW